MVFFFAKVKLFPLQFVTNGKCYLQFFAHYRDCAEMILKFHKVAKNAQLKVTFEKYMRPDLSGVAAIKHLDRLPL